MPKTDRHLFPLRYPTQTFFPRAGRISWFRASNGKMRSPRFRPAWVLTPLKVTYTRKLNIRERFEVEPAEQLVLRQGEVPDQSARENHAPHYRIPLIQGERKTP